jgi:hypothetical protein
MVSNLINVLLLSPKKVSSKQKEIISEVKGRLATGNCHEGQLKQLKSQKKKIWLSTAKILKGFFA